MLLAAEVIHYTTNGVSEGDLLIIVAIVGAAVGATWRLGGRMGRIEGKVDRHLGYHDGIETVKAHKDV